MTAKAVLFDLDGTLLDTLDDLADSMNRVLTEMGCPPHPTEAYKYFVGDGIETLARRVLPEKWRDDNSIKTCVIKMRSVYGDHWADRTKPFDGIAEMLSDLRGRGLRLAVLSNKPDDLTKTAVSHFFGEEQFDLVVGACSKFPKKPDPAGAVRIGNRLGINPEEFLYIGDTSTDMQTAVRAGMFPLGVLWGFRTSGELTQSGAKGLVKRPVEIVKYL